MAADLLRRLRQRMRLGLPVAWERIVWGGRRRERVLVALLGGHYRSLFRREWQHAASVDELPHFADHRLGMFQLAVQGGGAAPYSRGFFAAEVMRPGDRVLDIGCGDGFFDRAFFASSCAAVDAIDVEPAAIDRARRLNPAPNVSYHRLDAVADDFPAGAYDVIVWDGALGHFRPETTEVMLAKIRGALAPCGAFVGSESLGREGADHLQFFDQLGDLERLLKRHFAEVQVRELEYELGDSSRRREGFWRCASRPERLSGAAWRSSTLPA